ncbi:hypothetical protein [Sodalis glossinidius]|uniref:hypothetical protein n=1 Tax=Sodalis glossinidius TaxID=63612 RepID=UPI000311FE1F|nr:hypothetical protein [Sodalis glossinidius]
MQPDNAPATGGTEEDEEEDKISINTASLDDLVKGLKGIGPATMARLKDCLKL